VDGFKIDGLRYATGSGIVLEKCNDITIKNCLFARNSPFPGTGLSNQHIRVISSKHINVNHCIFDSGFHSIWMSSCDRVSIFNNTFWNNGISSVYVGCSPAAEVKIYNNIFMDVTTGHHSPAAATAASGPKILCDYNLYWKTAYNPQMRFYGVGGNNLPGSAPWHVKTKDSPETIEGVREKYGMEKHGQFADPLFINPKYGDFRLKAGSPALGKGRNGANIGANADIFIK
jgi:pectate lyase